MADTGTATLDEVCVVACAEAWRGDGEVLASAFGVIPTIAARLAKAAFEPDLLVTDGEAYVIANPLPLAAGSEEKVVEGWLPFRSVFDLVWAGRRQGVGPTFAFLITGSFIVETLFSIPGIGRSFVSSISGRDYTMILGTTILFAVLIAVVNLIVDVLYVFIDPRVRISD